MPAAVVIRGGVGGLNQAPPQEQATPPAAGIPPSPGSRHPPTAGTPPGAGTPCGQTHACKHITLPQTSFAGGKNRQEDGKEK